MRLALVFLAAAACFAEDVPIPAEMSFLSTFGKMRSRYPYEAWSEVKFPADTGTPQRGHHWDIVAHISAASERVAAWNLVKPALLKAGWTVESINPNGGFTAVIHFKANGVDAWARLSFTEGFPGVDVIGDLIEVAPPPVSLTLPEPAAKPEQIAPDKGDFPYLPPLPKSKFHSGRQVQENFTVTPKGSDQAEVVATSTLTRSYSFDGMSNVLFATVYHDALMKAGWEIVRQSVSADALIVAHYAKNGRNIWASLHNNGDGYDITIAGNGGADQLKASLAKSCHVALYGVLFDFNKATLQPASDGPLQQVLGILSADKTLKLEVQGHTDNVGTPAYNQTLSEARARAVAAWMTQHGVAPDRLTAKGYGLTMPVADNGSDEGRAKNRRVEIADLRCKSQGK